MKNNHFSSRRFNRRKFLHSNAALALPWVLPRASFSDSPRPDPSNRIHIGVVGVGAQGRRVMREFLTETDVQVVAVCDVDSLHYRDQEWGDGPPLGRDAGQREVNKFYQKQAKSGQYQGCRAYSDYRELCAQVDIDAVLVGTPDHWHALCVLEALRHGKDVYCEKPVTHLFGEGQAVYREVAKRKAIFQTGSQQRSGQPFLHAVELVHNGHIGTVHRVEVGLPSGYAAPRSDPTEQEPPAHLDYEFWCGPSQVLPYMRARHHRWWRGHSAYGGGNLMDWIGHHNDIAHWGLGLDHSGPIRVEAVGWSYPESKVYDMPVHYEIRSHYEGGVTSTISSANAMGAKWIGDAGWIHVDRGMLEAHDQRLVDLNYHSGPKKTYHSPGHVRNFLDGVKTRKPCVAPAETAHRSITPGHLGFVSKRLDRPLDWDPRNERVLNDAEANRLLQAVHYRAPWTLG